MLPLVFREQSAQLGAPLKIGEACSFHTFCTNNYKLHFYEALSGIKVHTHPPVPHASPCSAADMQQSPPCQPAPQAELHSLAQVQVQASMQDSTAPHNPKLYNPQ